MGTMFFFYVNTSMRAAFMYFVCYSATSASRPQCSHSLFFMVFFLVAWTGIPVPLFFFWSVRICIRVSCQYVCCRVICSVCRPVRGGGHFRAPSPAGLRPMDQAASIAHHCPHPSSIRCSTRFLLVSKCPNNAGTAVGLFLSIHLFPGGGFERV